MMTGSASDPQSFQQHLYSKNERKELESRFRDPDDPFKLVIVCEPVIREQVSYYYQIRITV